ncbi:MAG: signal peptidase I [Abditibacteriales bacterium]|nr:signal peptidase I [Abditibacteriales bacterium]MDW8367684.1 signal peptidase I [Abditibacteriales bacterium]
MTFQNDNLHWVVLVLLVLGIARVVIYYGMSANDPKSSEQRKFYLETIDSGLIALTLVFFIVRPFIVQAFYIPSESMRNTLEVNDRILVSKFVYYLRPPERGDIVVFHAPEVALGNPQEQKEFIKRLIGKPGDVVEIKDGKLFINGQVQEEPYIRQPGRYAMKIVDGKVYWSEWSGQWYLNDAPVSDPARNEAIRRAPPGKIPEGKYLVLGDNRPNSNDSHKWGLLDGDRIIGKAMCIFWPPKNNEPRYGLDEEIKDRWRIGILQ